jgi:hypothetical protein
VVNAALGNAALAPVSIVLHASGAIEAELAQYIGGSPNTSLHPGVAYRAVANAATDVFMSDLSTALADGTAVKRTVYLYNPTAAAEQVSATYFGGAGATTTVVYSVPGGGILTVNANQDTQPAIPAGPIGAEFKLPAGSSGAFIAGALGITVDGLSATEDAGVAD